MTSLARIPGPVPVAVTSSALEPTALTRLDDRFRSTTNWVRHDASFYRCWIAEADDALPEAMRHRLRDEVANALGLDLAGPVRITVQRMDVGDGADRHTDRPLVGYECARWIAQLDTPSGGCFRMLEPDGDDWRTWLERPATRNQAIAFELCDAAHHEVAECRTARRTVVLHFWHRANPPHARDLVHAWLAPMSFASLPRALDSRLAEADATTDDHVTGFAARVAWLLDAWGHGDVVGAFARALTGAPPASEDEARARFVVELALESFDRRAFEALPVRARQWWLDALEGRAASRG
ncbi:MAG: hypothetical protein AAF211_12320 [Myxococcota bacterium]